MREFSEIPDFRFFFRLVDRVGILQHSRFSKPSEITGYSLDDNARGLIVAALAYKNCQDERFGRLIGKLLTFLETQKGKSGFFRNYRFVSHGEKFLSREWGEDSFGEVVWALGFLLTLDLDGGIKKRALLLLEDSFEKITAFSALRSKAYFLLGLSFYYRFCARERVGKLAISLADDICLAFKKGRGKNWDWYENCLTYANAIFPYGLLVAFLTFKERRFLKTGKRSFDFLAGETLIDGLPAPIGQRGWYYKGKERALFDQQPIEAGYMVLACLIAFKATKDKDYAQLAKDWFLWFHGNNLAGLSLIDKRDGGCYDGLEPWKVNLNKGAESTICYLLACLFLRRNKVG